MTDAEKRLNEQIEKSIELTQKMLDPENGLEARIKSLETTGGNADLKEKVQKMATDNADAIDSIKTLTEKVRAEMTERQDEFETKHVPGSNGAPVDHYQPFVKSLQSAELPTDHTSDDLRKKLRAGIGSVLNADSLFSRKTVTALAASGGDTIIPAYEPTIVAPGEAPITILDVLPKSPVSTPLIYYVVEVLASRTNGADIQSLDFTGTGQGDTLGSSDFVFNQLSEQTRTFGHYAKISTQMLADVGQMRGYMENRMRYMVRFDLENQIVTKAGAGKDLNGMKNRATAYDVGLKTDLGVTNIQNLDVLRCLVHQCTLTYFPATFILLHPVQASGLELIKDGNQSYLWVNPGSGNNIRPWGVPLVSSIQQTDGDFTAGAGNQIEVMVRQEIEVLIATENDTDFIKELATIKATGRFGVKFYQPTAIIDGDFTSAKA